MTGDAVGGRRAMPGEPRDESCTTCSDGAETAVLIELLGDHRALVDTGSGTEEVSVALVEAKVGDRILVHAKEALVVVEES